MDIIQNNKESLTITEKPWKSSFFLFIITMLSLYFFIINLNALNPEQYITASIIILLLSFAAYATRKKSYIHFDATLQTVSWYREELFHAHKGTFKFSQIKNIMRKESIGADDKSYFIFVRLKDETKIKITLYELEIEACEVIQNTISEYLEKYTI